MSAESEQTKAHDKVGNLGRLIINLFEDYFKSLQLTPRIHFELEGWAKLAANTPRLNFEAINQKLKVLGILGELKAEYWQNQWEYVSLFAKQSVLKEASDLHFVIHRIPEILASFGVLETRIKPVIWAGDKGKLASGSKNIFTLDKRAVHIPNAVQINISVEDANGQNLMAESDLAFYLQQSLMQSSSSCSLLFLPEEDAYKRLALKTEFGLAEELCSPCDISGGHQGSIALYREHGKHNQKMGQTNWLIGADNSALISSFDWKQTARIEHRLGAASTLYDPFANALFALANLATAVNNWQQQLPLLAQTYESKLPKSLMCSGEDTGAIELFARDSWFSDNINHIQSVMCREFGKQAWRNLPIQAGNEYKSLLMTRYRKSIVC